MESRSDNLVGWLTIAFVVLKLCDVIDWSWWWVLSPIWGMLIIFLLFVGCVYAWQYVKEKLYWRKRKISAKKFRYENFKREIKIFGQHELHKVWLKSQDAYGTDKAKEFDEFLKRYNKESK